MTNEDRLSGALQENVLTLLCFDDSRALQVRATLETPRLFESAIYREVAGHAFDFLDQFGVAIKEHLPDQLDSILSGDDARKAAVYKQLLTNLHAARDTINGEYVVSQLHKFVRQQRLKSAVISAVEALEVGAVDDAEVGLQHALSSQITTFEMGLHLNSPDQALAFMDNRTPGILTGIGGLDAFECQPAKKELFLLMAPPSRGKTWGLIHLAKWALLQQQTVIHITLEMSEARVAQRYVQSFFSVAKREGKSMIPILQKDEQGRMQDIVYETIERTSLTDPGSRARLSNRIKRDMSRRPPLIIKEFPTGALTIPKLNSYLDSVERLHKIMPDYVVIDYPDLMSLDARNMRVEIGELMKNLRGVGVERNIGIVAATQTNREGATARLIDETKVAEDWSKIMIADSIVSYNQTEEEKRLGLARGFVVKSRNDESRFSVLMTQNYGIGQFCLDSALMPSDYWGFIDEQAAH